MSIMSNPQLNKVSVSAKTLVESAVDAVLEYIRSNKLTVDDKLPSESYFIQELAVSRTVIRETFKSLSAMGIIVMSAGKRAQVSSFNNSVFEVTLIHALCTNQINVQQIWDARRALELRTVELAAMHRTEKQAIQLQKIVDEMRASYTDINIMTAHDISFHKLIAQATNNPLFPVLVSSLVGAIKETNPIVWRYRQSSHEQLEVVELHQSIADAIVARQPTAAVAALAKHFDVAMFGLVKAGFN